MDERTDDNKTRVWLITGCSSGFGRIFIPAILARGDKVIATARNIISLQSLPKEEDFKSMQLDVTASQEILNQRVAEATDLFGRIDVLVNNAGYVASGVWEEVTHEETLQQFMTNVFGALNMTRAVLPQMRTRRSGTIVFMSSISGWLGAGAGGPYSGSKFALEGAVECLHKETVHLDIETYLIVLGQFRTDILNPKNRRIVGHSRIAAYAQVAEAMTTRHEETDGRQPGDPELAVERILDIIRREGAMKSKKALPLRIALGSDAVGVIRTKCNETLKTLNEYEDFSRSTDYAESTDIPVYR